MFNNGLMTFGGLRIMRFVHFAVFAVMLAMLAYPAAAQGARPVAALSVTPQTVCTGAPVYFDASASYDTDGQIQQYIFDYGDGAEIRNIGFDFSYHHYLSAGTYYAKVRVIDNSGQISDYSNIVPVQVLACSDEDHYPVIESASISPQEPDLNDDIVCSARFSDLDNDVAFAKIIWYRNGAKIKEETKNICSGCNSAESTLPSVATEAGDSVACEFSVYDYTGRRAVTVRSVQVGYLNAKPVAVLSAGATRICAGETVMFDASASYDPDGFVSLYYYEFGDGTSSPWLAGNGYAYHMYAQEGVYYARAKVKDNDQQISDWSNHVRIIVEGACGAQDNAPSILGMGISPSSPTTQDDISCEITASDEDGDLERIEVEWKIGESTVRKRQFSASGFSASARDTLPSAYTSPGDIVECIASARDMKANTASSRRSAAVQSMLMPPVASLSADRASVCPGEAVTFDASASYDADGMVKKYYFEFGDGSYAGWTASKTAVHYYDSEGSYTARLRVMDDEGLASSYDTAQIMVKSPSECGRVQQPETEIQAQECSVQITNFDFLASGLTGNNLWAKATVKNEGQNAEYIDVYLYVDDVLEDQYRMRVMPSSKEAKKFYYRVSEPGRKEVRVAAYAECGSSDEKSGFVEVEEGFVPEPAPEPDPLRVLVYPKTLDLVAGEGRSFTIEMHSPEKREFEITVEGIRDEWVEYKKRVIVDGSKKEYVFINPLETGKFNVVVKAATGDKTFTHNIYVYVAPVRDKEKKETSLTGPAGLISGGMGSWIVGIIVVIALLAVIIYIKRSEKKEKATYIASERRAVQQHQMQGRESIAEGHASWDPYFHRKSNAGINHSQIGNNAKV